MNTRLQVEHPVTEMVTNFDLVQWQLSIAEGRELPITQDELSVRGHAIEARLYAEDPDAGFLPQVGTILRWRPDDRCRVDAGIAEGSEVTAFYDPMIAKLIAFGVDREEARRRLLAGLRRTRLLGLTTNQRFLAELVASRPFIDAQIRTDTLEKTERTPVEPPDRAWALAAILRSRHDGVGAGWRSSGELHSVVELRAGEASRALRVAQGPDSTYTVEGQPPLQVVSDDTERAVVVQEGLRTRVDYVVEGEHVCVADDDGTWSFREPSAAATGDDGAADGVVRSPIGGRVMSVAVAAGDAVERGQTLLVVEAMKLEHRILASVAGTVKRVAASADDQVTDGQVLVELEPKD